MTFSIVARCPRTGALGVAVSSAVPAVGAVCPYLRANVGAVSTQSWVNPYLAIDALDLLAQGMDADQVLHDVLKSDGAAATRQIGLVDGKGHAASWTGSACTEWAGQRDGVGYAIQGNMLVGAETLDAMVVAFEKAFGLDLAERLMRSLEAGDRAGGDSRGRQSAALKVVQEEAYAIVDVRVDEHPDPVTELRRVLTVAQQQLTPFIESMPSRNAPGRPPAEAVVALLSKPPHARGDARPPAAPAPSAQAQADVLATWMGVALAPERVQSDLRTYDGIRAEIGKLRGLDLSTLPPAVVFHPAASYSAMRGSTVGPDTKPEADQ